MAKNALTEFVLKHEGFLLGWGWSDAHQDFIRKVEVSGEIIGRVVEEHRDFLSVESPLGPISLQIPKRVRKNKSQGDLAPTVGDWVTARKEGSQFAFCDLVPRRSSLSRLDVSQTGRRQVMAANVDLAIVVFPLFPVEDLEVVRRYLWLAMESRLESLVILTKSDLVDSTDEDWRARAGIPNSSPYLLTSVQSGEGLSKLKEHLVTGRTLVLMGPSGAGKSSLINSLLGASAQKTQEVRQKDSRGRHTTTARRLFRIPEFGSMVIDIPGMRPPLEGEVDLLDAGLVDRLDEMALRCRFSNCAHQSEPGCALKEAAKTGELSAADLENYLAAKKSVD